MPTLSLDQARRIALAAQGFAEPRPRGRVDARHLRRVLARTKLLQIDSVNVLARAHYLPAFSRLGPYPIDALDRMAYQRRELFEYWGHEASLIPVEDHPLLRWRMARAAAQYATWGGIARLARKKPGYVERVYREVAARGPIAASELTDGHRRAEPWWGWGDAKRALEFLFWSGRITAASRRRFERLYDVVERVIPAAVLAAPTPSEDDAKAELLRRAARALGVATARDLADYYRLVRVGPIVQRLVEEGALISVRVEGWRQVAYLDPDARLPRQVQARALVAPFDPLVWERARTERLFGFRYRIEIYVPAPKRVHGYYVLPFLLGDRLVARVDLKADRTSGALRVQGAFAELDADRSAAASALAEELRTMAAWLGLERVHVGARGDLATPLRRAIRSGGPGTTPSVAAR